MAQRNHIADADAGNSRFPEHAAALPGEQAYFGQLVEALSSTHPYASDADPEPAYFAAPSQWQPWRADDVFLARPPHPLPRRKPRISPAATPVNEPAKTAAANGPAPSNEVSTFQRLLAPGIIMSTLSLAAITHGAVAYRSQQPRTMAAHTAESFERPFSLAGAWRRIGAPAGAERDVNVAIDERPALPSQEVVQPASQQQPRRASLATPRTPQQTIRISDTVYLQIAIDAICALPLTTASIAPQPPIGREPPLAEPHYSRLISTPLTELAPVEPWSAHAAASPFAPLPVKSLVAAVASVEALRLGGLDAVQPAPRQIQAAPPVLLKATSKTSSKPMEPDPPPVKKKPRATPAGGASPASASTAPEAAAARSPDNHMRDSP